jgi:hypothetical protein
VYRLRAGLNARNRRDMLEIFESRTPACACSSSLEKKGSYDAADENITYPSRESNPGLPRGRRVFYH